MKTLTLAILLCAGVALSQLSPSNPFFSAAVLKPAAAAGGNPPASPLINQNFEGTGYDNSESWTTAAGAPDPDYTTGPLVGSQSLRILGATDKQCVQSPAYTSSSAAWGYCRFKPINIAGSATDIASLFGGDLDQLAIRLNSDGSIRVAHGSATATTVSTMSAGTTYHMWFYYAKGTGANGVANVAFSTDGIRPTSGNNFASLTTGTYTGDVTSMLLGNYSFDRDWEGLFDHVYVDDEQIGDNP